MFGTERTKGLHAFIKKLAPEKLLLLKENFEYMYNLLRKPEDPVHKIEIDKDYLQLLDDIIDKISWL
jgi:hypothetical protein